MNKKLVLKLTDVHYFNGDMFSEQCDSLIEDEEIGLDYIWTDNDYIVDFEKDIDVNKESVQNAIKLGASLETMYYIEDENYQYYLEDFIVEYGFSGFFDVVEGGDPHGIMFELESDAKKYQQFLDILEFNYEYEYPIITKDSAIEIIKNTSLKHIASRLLEKQNYRWCGSYCYLDPFTGIVVTSEYNKEEYLQELSSDEILLARLSKDYNRESFREGIVEMNNDNLIKEFDINHLTSIIQLENYMERLEKFYDEEISDY